MSTAKDPDLEIGSITSEADEKDGTSSNPPEPIAHKSRMQSISYALNRTDTSRSKSKDMNKEFSRTLSVSLTNPAPRSAPEHRVPAEFNTLSIHVTLTRDQDKDGSTAKAGRKAIKELASLDWQSISSEEVASRLAVNPSRGLDKELVAKRLSADGYNIIKPAPKQWHKKIFWYIFGGFNTLLLLASLLCFISWKPLGDPPSTPNLALAVILAVVVSISIGFNAWQDFSTSRTMGAIGSMLPSENEVIREGISMKIPAKELVSGDVVKIGLGNKVPCDMRIIEATADAQFDRSVLTGESEPVDASTDPSKESFLESRNIALQGSLCVAGSVTAIALLTGSKTVFGRIAHLSSKQSSVKTTLEKEILHFVLIISSLAGIVCLVVIIAWAAWLRRDYPGFINVPNLLIDLVSVAVAFIPEGLPICVTLSLSIIANKMKNANVLCKSLTTVETLGCVDVILSDKTGTLTTNRMTVVEAFCGLERKRVIDIRSPDEKSTVSPLHTALADCAALNNDAVYDEGLLGAGEKPINGDATDSGLLRFADTLSSSSTVRSQWSQIYKLAFNSKNKFAFKLFRATTASSPILPSDVYNPESNYLLLVKGAPDILMQRCSSILGQNGESIPLDTQNLEKVHNAQQSMASGGQRVLLLARRIVNVSEIPQNILLHRSVLADAAMQANQDLQIVGLCGLIDPPRHDTLTTVQVCRGAGVRFMMVTGDFQVTAAAIARECGIFTTDEIDTAADLDKEAPIADIQPYRRKEEGEPLRSLVLSGTDLLTMTDSSWRAAVAYDEIVFARTTPEQKLKIVKAFQSALHVCAATGDGTNDSAAIKQADVGIAFGNGSAVAIEAADLVLLENLSAIVEGVRLGRLIFENLKKTILYLLPAGSFSELWPVLVSIFLGLPQPLSSIQMILICCLTDVMPGLSMVREQPESDLLKKSPRNIRKDRLADWRLLLHAYGFLGVLETLTSMVGAFYFGFQRNGVPFSALWLAYGRTPNVDPILLAECTARAQSIYFYNLVLMQIGNLLATRTRRLSILQHDPFFNKQSRNLFVVIAVAVAILMATLFSYVPGIQRVFDTRGVVWYLWLLPLAFAVAILVLDEMRKLWIRVWPTGYLAKLAW